MFLLGLFSRRGDEMAIGIKVSDIMISEVITGQKNETVYDAAKKMVLADVGFYLILENSVPTGVITRGDILKAVVNGVDIKSERVCEIMTKNPITIYPDADIEDAARIMRDKRIKRLPVVDKNGRLLGVVSETDLILVSPAIYEIIREKALMEGSK